MAGRRRKARVRGTRRDRHLRRLTISQLTSRKHRETTYRCCDGDVGCGRASGRRSWSNTPGLRSEKARLPRFGPLDSFLALASAVRHGVPVRRHQRHLVRIVCAIHVSGCCQFVEVRLSGLVHLLTCCERVGKLEPERRAFVFSRGYAESTSALHSAFSPDFVRKEAESLRA